jgi:dTDP-glucose 4,6-dehydratase
VKTVFVTGGCGFIGSHFIRLLLRRGADRVVNLDKLTYAGDLGRLDGIADDQRYRFVRGDIADGSLVHEVMEAERPWAIVNFAAESHVDRSILDPAPFLRTNIEGTQVLLDSARRHAVSRFLQVSTDEVYGDAEAKAPFSEESPVAPSSPYSVSKAAADLLCLAYHRTYGVPVIIARSSNNYGPFQFPEKLIPLMIRNALNGEMLPVYGDGGQWRDWLFVEDNCDALLAILERGRVGAVYNVAAGQERPNLEVVRALCRLLADETGKDAEELLSRIQFVPDRPGHDRRYAVDTRRVTEEISWKPKVGLDEGLRLTVRWYLANRDWVERVASGEYLNYYQAVYAQRWGRDP